MHLLGTSTKSLFFFLLFLVLQPAFAELEKVDSLLGGSYFDTILNPVYPTTPDLKDSAYASIYPICDGRLCLYAADMNGDNQILIYDEHTKTWQRIKNAHVCSNGVAIEEHELFFGGLECKFWNLDQKDKVFTVKGYTSFRHGGPDYFWFVKKTGFQTSLTLIDVAKQKTIYPAMRSIDIDGFNMLEGGIPAVWKMIIYPESVDFRLLDVVSGEELKKLRLNVRAPYVERSQDERYLMFPYQSRGKAAFRLLSFRDLKLVGDQQTNIEFDDAVFALSRWGSFVAIADKKNGKVDVFSNQGMLVDSLDIDSGDNLSITFSEDEMSLLCLVDGTINRKRLRFSIAPKNFVNELKEAIGEKAWVEIFPLLSLAYHQDANATVKIMESFIGAKKSAEFIQKTMQKFNDALATIKNEDSFEKRLEAKESLEKLIKENRFADYRLTYQFARRLEAVIEANQQGKAGADAESRVTARQMLFTLMHPEGLEKRYKTILGRHSRGSNPINRSKEDCSIHEKYTSRSTHAYLRSR